MKEKIQEIFKQRFGTDSVVYASAGRINLIGEHTDYNGGFVFPGARKRLLQWIPKSCPTRRLLNSYSRKKHESELTWLY